LRDESIPGNAVAEFNRRRTERQVARATRRVGANIVGASRGSTIRHIEQIKRRGAMVGGVGEKRFGLLSGIQLRSRHHGIRRATGQGERRQNQWPVGWNAGSPRRKSWSRRHCVTCRMDKDRRLVAADVTIPSIDHAIPLWDTQCSNARWFERYLTQGAPLILCCQPGPTESAT
jgi:hypothetical protein